MLAKLAMLVLLSGMALASSAVATTPHPPESEPAKVAKICRLGPLKAKANAATLIDCPADVQPLVDRALGCQHWTGEEPYDNARAHEIETAIDELKCGQLSLEYDALMKKYAKQPDVTGTLEAADREYSLEF